MLTFTLHPADYDRPEIRTFGEATNDEVFGRDGGGGPDYVCLGAFEGSQGPSEISRGAGTCTLVVSIVALYSCSS